jgi:serine/threonine protein phosphatase PrpC/CRP-like cAMP-binding protein
MVARITADGFSHQGRVRDHNEDAILMDVDFGLFAVADGMGGHAAGEVASRLAVDTVQRCLREGIDRIRAFEAAPGERALARDVARLLDEAIQSACAAVYEAGQADERKRGMGTTLCTVLRIADHAFIANVGDSRIYLVRGDTCHQLTQDHNLQNELLKRGRLAPEAIARVKQKNALTRAVGVYATVEVDTLKLELIQGDQLVLCSDGLYSYVSADDLVPILQGKDERIAERLVDLANQRGGNDNISAIVLSIGAVGSAERAELTKLTFDTLQAAQLFHFFNYQELVKVASIVETKAFVRDERIFREGDPGDCLYVVLSGRVSVRKGDNAIASLGPFEHFGEMALVDREPRSATVTAIEDTRLLSMKRADFLYLVKHERDMAVKLLWQFIGVLTARLRNTSRDLGEARSRIGGEAAFARSLADDDIEVDL